MSNARQPRNSTFEIDRVSAGVSLRPGPAPLALPKGPHSPGELHFGPRQHLQASSDIAGRGGTPRLATAWDTEARSVPIARARSVNTEAPGRKPPFRVAAGGLERGAEGAA